MFFHLYTVDGENGGLDEELVQNVLHEYVRYQYEYLIIVRVSHVHMYVMITC
jgi:hypothetical protein